MRGCQNVFLFAFVGGLILLISKMHLASASYSMDQTCQYLPDKTFIGNPDSCGGFGYCSNGVALAGTCSTANTQYDMGKGECVYNGQCQTTVADMCANVQADTLVMDPSNCKRYCMCGSSGYVASNCNTCPDGYYFDPSINLCNWDTAVKCSADSICRLVKDGTLIGDPDNCGNYLLCYQGVVYGETRTCTDTTKKFDPKLGACSSSYTCDDSSTPSDIPQTIPCTDSFDKYVTDGVTCSGFYDCKTVATADDKGTWGSCPQALHFDPDSQECVSPASYACPYNRCNNMNITYMAVAGTSCKTIKFCGTGADYKCSSAWPTKIYFDERTQSCVDEMPDYPICA